MELNTSEAILVNMREKFGSVRKLLDDHEKSAVENEPYKLKYEAIKILKEMEVELIDVLKDTPEKQVKEEHTMLAIVHLNLGLLHADTEELKSAEEQFLKCLEIMKGRELEPEAILPVLGALNQLGIIWSQWSQPAKAKVVLDQAKQIYTDFTNTGDNYKDPINMAQNFGIETKDDLHPKKVLEKLHTLTLYYLAQVYGSLKDHHKSAVYCHMTLQRQLGSKEIMQDLDYVDWALNAATLSQYFIEKNCFSQARHHLAAAFYILQEYESILKKRMESNEKSELLTAEWENYKHRSADVARCWAKYGICLLSLSKERLLQRIEIDDETEISESKDESERIDSLKFEILEEKLKAITDQITEKYLLDFNDAKPVFLNVQKWLEQAKTYYTLENHASDYVALVQDMSQAYKYLSFYEQHEDRQSKMHKRRIDILENVIKELNPQYYKAICRQIWIELGETYGNVLDIKLDRLRATDEKPTPQALAKINHLAKSAIKNFKSFLDSVEIRSRSVTDIEQLPEDVVELVLLAHFQLGWLYNKMITPDKAIQLENAENSFNAYRFIINYCEKYPSAAEFVKVELNLCKEVVSLLPLKINKLRQDVLTQ